MLFLSPLSIYLHNLFVLMRSLFFVLFYYLIGTVLFTPVVIVTVQFLLFTYVIGVYKK